MLKLNYLSIMLLRWASIRGFIILIMGTVITYTMFLRWLFVVNYHPNDLVYPSPTYFISKEEPQLSSPTIFTNTPMHDELVRIRNLPVR